jgi:nicotinate phosphoribosyltransferase
MFLVDTIDTLRSGVQNAITVFRELRGKGHEPVGIRLDSGDLAYLAIQSAKMLDEAGFPDASIVLSNDLDEMVIWQIIKQIQAEAGQRGLEAERVISRLVYGVGTRLVTSGGDSALGGVYKLVALRDGSGEWQPAIKVSEVAAKTPTPGVKRAYRLYDRDGTATADLLALEGDSLESPYLDLRHPMDTQRRGLRREGLTIEELLVPVIVNGKRVAPPATLAEMRARRYGDVARLDPGVRRLINPHIYHVSLTPELWALKQRLIEEARASAANFKEGTPRTGQS